ncbi:MAG: ATP-dependent DNA helicase DinG, partial [Spirochaetaceae bacterium]|nr:ATP-dependent DNA helicase DinG [Spirochaetaceae bacterium]
MQAIQRFTEESRAFLRQEIESARGAPIRALGYLDEEGLIEKVEPAAEAAAEPEAGRALSDTAALPKGADAVIAHHPSGFLTPSDTDLIAASRALAQGAGYFIVDSAVERVYVVCEPAKKRGAQKLNGAVIRAALEKGGAIARRLQNYESRSSQLDLMGLIIKGFNEDALVAAEAGTGVGKSFAYLLPALSFAIINDERIVISTATITLQQQLYEKDIPLVVSAMKKKVKTVLVKGRGNYLCLRRLGELRRERELLEEEERSDLEAVAEWAAATETGARSDIPFMLSERFWLRVCSESDGCMGHQCPLRERCFVLALRRECADARVLVVNHHLLFADLAARHKGAGYAGTVVLPPYRRVVIDEAHTIEAAATSFFSKEFSRPGLYRQLGRLYRRRGGNRTGILLRLLPPFSDEARIADLSREIQRARELADALDTAALELCQPNGVFRLTPQRESLIQAALVPALTDLRASLRRLTGQLTRFLDETPDDFPEDETALWEARSILRRLEAVNTMCSSFIAFKEQAGEVLWIERRFSSTGTGGGNWAAFAVTPIDVASSLKEALFEPNRTVVCVSATLTVKGSFAYWSGRSGLDLAFGRKALTGQFPSPFPYAKAVLLAIPQDAPMPDQGDYRDFVDRAAVSLALRAGGSALILFTSYEALRSAYNAALPVLSAHGIHCLKQGDDDRNRLLQSFLRDEKSVLFATDSFWEGIDAPGDT